MKQSTYLIFALLTLMLSACATTPSGVIPSLAPKLTREVGQLNLQYDFSAGQAAPTNQTIAILSPEVMRQQNTAQAMPAGLAALIAASQGGQALRVDFNQRYAAGYEGQVRTAFDNAFQELLTRKGFHLKGPFASFDDMAYADRKNSYLALAPLLKIYIEKKVTDSDFSGWSNVRTETGTIMVSGELMLNFIEPVTRERIMAKRVNLGDFNIQRDYKVQAKVGTSGIMVDAMTSGQELVDNSDKVLTEAVNEFFARSMAKIATMVSTEELLSFQKSVADLKEMKRY